MAVWPGSRTEQGLTGHEQVGPVPLLLTVMQCPQIDHHICALVNGKVTNAAPGRERKRGSGILPLPTCSAPSLCGPPLWGKEPFTPSCPLPHLFLSFYQVDYESSPLLLPSTYVSTLVGLSGPMGMHVELVPVRMCVCCGYWIG